MTHVELKDDLIERIGWAQTPSTFPLTLDAANLTSDSGRFFNEDEYDFISLQTIYDTMEDKGADATTFNAYLKRLRDRVILLVLADVFRIWDIDDNVLTGRTNIFDNAISKRMAIMVGENILTSLRANRNERISKEFQDKIFWELNGNADNSSARANQNFPTYIGLKSRYGMEIEKLRDLLEQEEKLDCKTMKLPNYLDDDSARFYYPE